MPELPEVETIKNELGPHVVGRRISGVTLFWEGIVKRPSVAEFRSRLIGQRITGLVRHGKYLSFKLSGGEVLVVHLKMSGSLLIGKGEPPKYTRAIIQLDNGNSIFFRDPRKFGTIQLVKDKESILGKIGPEPLEPSFTSDMLEKRLLRTQSTD
jgi:formamidopyrimidine-DNA glycosylase